MATKPRICDKCKAVVPEDSICDCLKRKIINSGERISVLKLDKGDVLVFHVSPKILETLKDDERLKAIFGDIEILLVDENIKMSVVKKEIINDPLSDYYKKGI